MKRFLRVIALSLSLLPASIGLVTLTAPVGALACTSEQIQIAIAFPGGTNCVDNNPDTGGAIVAYLKVLLQYLASLVGTVVVLMLVIGGIQYIVSAGDPVQIKNAKSRIINALTALVLFLSSFAILNFIIPGGLT